MKGWLSALPLVAAAASAQDPISLQELRQIAQQRFEAERPEQLAALEPFLADLQMDYPPNAAYLDPRFRMAAQLGDGIVPALLERLVPEEEGDRVARNVADNSARILLAIDPSGFADSLIELLESSSYTARRHAIWLLGHSENREAARALATLLDTPNVSQRIHVVRALQQLGAADPAAAIAAFLTSDNQGLKAAALDYLAAVKPPAALDAVLAALAAEQSAELLPSYVSYLDGAARHDAKAAHALVALLKPDHPDRDLVLAVVRALARVAPQGHAATAAGCKAILEQGETSELGLACALTMQAVGDDAGVKHLLNELNKAIYRDRSNDALFVSRGNVYRAIEKWDDASRDYQEAVERTANLGLKRQLHLLVARCEAHLEKMGAVLKALKDSGASHASIMAAAAEDEALRRALDQPAIRRYLDRLPKSGRD